MTVPNHRIYAVKKKSLRGARCTATWFLAWSNDALLFGAAATYICKASTDGKPSASLIVQFRFLIFCSILAQNKKAHPLQGLAQGECSTRAMTAPNNCIFVVWCLYCWTVNSLQDINHAPPLNLTSVVASFDTPAVKFGKAATNR